MAKYRIIESIEDKNVYWVTKYSNLIGWNVVTEYVNDGILRHEVAKAFATVEDAETWIKSQKTPPAPTDKYIKEIEI